MSNPQESEKDWKKMAQEMARLYDFKGLAEMFAKGNMAWHEQEWKEFISGILTQKKQRIEERIENFAFECMCLNDGDKAVDIVVAQQILDEELK